MSRIRFAILVMITDRDFWIDGFENLLDCGVITEDLLYLCRMYFSRKIELLSRESCKKGSDTNSPEHQRFHNWFSFFNSIKPFLNERFVSEFRDTFMLQ